jgi:glycerophosphoryl diester phosphodiesterase
MLRHVLIMKQALGGGRKTSGYFASDLTLEQIKTLWAAQSFPERDQSVDGKYRCRVFSR